MTAGTRPRRLVTVAAGLRQPSSTRLLADRMSAAVVEALGAAGIEVEASTIDLREHARDLTTMMLTGLPTPAASAVIDMVAEADALVVVTPIYSGSYPGMLKDLVDLLPEKSLAGVPVVMGATAGTARHALALEHTLRPLLSYLRAWVAPTGVFAATEDFGESPTRGHGDGSLADRIGRAAQELAELVAARPARGTRDQFAVPDLDELLRGLGGQD